jgi:hypothetical protein
MITIPSLRLQIRPRLHRFTRALLYMKTLSKHSTTRIAVRLCPQSMRKIKSPCRAKIAIMRRKVKMKIIALISLPLLSKSSSDRRNLEARDRLRKDPPVSSKWLGAGPKREMLFVKSSLSKTSSLNKRALATELCLTFIRNIPLC